MKLITASLLLLMAIFLFPSKVGASPGGLDQNGGHHCRKSKAYCAKYGMKLNQYHCHRTYCKLKKF